MKGNDEPPKKRLKRQFKPGQYTLTEEKINRIISSTTNLRDKCIIKSLFWGGMRREEVVSLEVQDINLEEETIQICGKFGKVRVVPILNDEYKVDLKHYISNRKKGRVFLTNQETPMTTRNINKICQKLGELAGVKNPDPMRKAINPHIFRHSISRWLKDSGYGMEFVQNFLGHSDFSLTYGTYGTMGMEQMLQKAREKKETIRRG